MRTGGRYVGTITSGYKTPSDYLAGAAALQILCSSDHFFAAAITFVGLTQANSELPKPFVIAGQLPFGIEYIGGHKCRMQSNERSLRGGALGTTCYL